MTCHCFSCLDEQTNPETGFRLSMLRMALCDVCGNKRCPRATDHRFACTGSNDAGQTGSRYSGSYVKDMESAFEEWWESRRRASWERTCLPSERGKPMPVNWGNAYRRECFAGWMGAVRWCRLCQREHEGACVTSTSAGDGNG
jgi:hypothetical protein